MIKAVLFDFDDTLVQTKQVKWQALTETGHRHFQLTITPNDISKYWGLPYRQVLLNLFQHIDTYENINQAYLEVTQEFPMTAYPHAVDTINTLAAKLPTGIVTASSKDMVLPDLKALEFDLDNLFHIQTSEDTDFHKPDPRVFSPSINKLKRLGISPHQTIYIGDSPRDQQAAQKAGLQFLGIVHNTSNPFPAKTPFITSLDQVSSHL